jgi:peptidyl-prolyl cis-trans isomerase B (cyclophilin B)
MKNFIKYGLPLITIIVIFIIGFYLFRPPSTTSSGTVAEGCNIKFQPDVKKYTEYPTMCINENKTYTATIETSMGNIVMNLLPKAAPKTVNSFVFLAKSGFFNNLLFHRVIPSFVIQGGDPNGDGTGGPGYQFADEISATALGLSQSTIKDNESLGYKYDNSLPTVKILAGTLAMANSGPNTNGSQFYIALTDQPALDGKYTPFGEVTSGMDIANEIAAVKTDSSNKPLTNVVIKTISITEK